VDWNQVINPTHLPRVDKERMTIELCENMLVCFTGSHNKQEFFDFLSFNFGINYAPFDSREIVNKVQSNPN